MCFPIKHCLDYHPFGFKIPWDSPKIRQKFGQFTTNLTLPSLANCGAKIQFPKTPHPYRCFAGNVDARYGIEHFIFELDGINPGSVED